MKTHWFILAFIGCFSVTLAGVAFFLTDPKPSGWTDFESYQEEVLRNEQTRIFSSVESESQFLLTYRWEDFEQRKLESTFSISKRILKEAEDEFGFFPDELDQYVHDSLAPNRREMIAYLRAFTQNLIRKSRYSEHFSIEDKSTDSFNIKLSVPPSNYAAVKPEFERITRLLLKEQSKFDKKIEKAAFELREKFLEEKGLRQLETSIGVNYGRVARNNQPRLEGAFKSLQRIAQDMNLHQFVSLLLSFLQEIRYGVPPVSENGKNILGFWVPPKVLATNFGDCDCKGATFASLWLNYKKYPLLLIKIPKHMFIGLAIPSFSGEGAYINGLRYTLCEVTGPDKIPMGIISPYSRMYFEGGSYSYELIE